MKDITILQSSFLLTGSSFLVWITHETMVNEEFPDLMACDARYDCQKRPLYLNAGIKINKCFPSLFSANLFNLNVKLLMQFDIFIISI